jgi:hypothetical protein
VGVNFKHGAALAQQAMESMEEPDITEPANPATGASPVELKKWEASFDDYRKKKNAWDDVRPRVFQLCLVHCHPDMEQKVTSAEQYSSINGDQNFVKLLKLMRSIAHQHDDVKGGTMSRVQHDLNLITCFQEKGMSNNEYYRLFKASRDVVNVHGGCVGFHQGLFNEHVRELKKANNIPASDRASDAIRAEALSKTCNEYLGCLFILNSDKDRFSGLKQTLDNANLFGNDDYPKSIEEAVKLMENHKTPTNRNDQGGYQYSGQGREEGVAFLSQETRRKTSPDTPAITAVGKGIMPKTVPRGRQI